MGFCLTVFFKQKLMLKPNLYNSFSSLLGDPFHRSIGVSLVGRGGQFDVDFPIIILIHDPIPTSECFTKILPLW